MSSHPQGVEVLGPKLPDSDRVLTPEALAFVAGLHHKFNAERLRLLAARKERQKKIDAGERPDFLASTKSVREGSWKVNPVPADLQDRRVEITGPTDRKMLINALNSGARVFMADLEDSLSPTWANVISGQGNLMDAVRRTISLETKEKKYALNEKIATLMVRPRGWHLPEKHVRIDGEITPGSLFDFGLYFFHNAKETLKQGTGPYFYLPKMESHLEARLWNNVFLHAQEALGIPKGTIKATVLIETILAAFETDEILYELREHSAGLNCGRWDYIFSFIKKFRNAKEFLMPDRAQVSMTVPFMRAYCLEVIKNCHRRGAHAMGGMAAQIPIKSDAAANEAALTKVRTDKEREANDGHDGTWVAHPGLVPIALEAFNKVMPKANQVDRQRDDVKITAAQLIEVPKGTITEEGLRLNLRVGIQYVAAWLAGNGCVPLYNLMEDAATAEISRAQIWQWLKWGAKTDQGVVINSALFDKIVPEELARIEKEVGPAFAKGKYREAAEMFSKMSMSSEFDDFLTLPAYERLD
jgi:malate synthase